MRRFLFSWGSRAAVALAIAATLTILLFPSVSASGDETTCPHGTREPVEVGIVTATACFTQATVSGATVDTAAFADNPNGIDVNGFVITGASGNGIQINEKTHAVTSVQVSSGNPVSVQLNSRNWPLAGKVQSMGSPFVISFTAPNSGSFQLTDIRLGSNQIAGALAGLSPVGTIDTPVMLEPDGEGSMDLTVALAGIFTLKDKPQSVTIALPTKPEEGTKFDGFELSLKEIDGLKFIKIYDLEAHYSASQKLISGTATLGFPFFGEGKGVGVSLTIQNGVLTDLGVNVTGVHIPIGAVGAITAMNGGFHVSGEVALNFDGYCKSIGYESGVIVGGATGPDAFTHWKCHKGSTNDGVDVGKACLFTTGNPASQATYTDPNSANSWICSGAPPSIATSFDLGATAGLSADFGPSIETKVFGDIAPVAADAQLAINYKASELVVALSGKFYLFRIPVGDAYLRIHSNSGVEFGAAVGIGVPSFTRKENDAFYLGLGVSGWFSRGKFQLEGQGKFRLFGADILAGDGLINDRGIGACWTVLGVPGGAFFRWGSSGPETFGFNSCRLGDYREQFPGGAADAAGVARSFTLRQPKTVLAVRGAGAAPRFELRSAGGRVIRTPAKAGSALTSDYAVFVNKYANTTYVVLPRARGRWTITPYRGSATVTGVGAAQIAPSQRVAARVTGTGTTRTLVYSSLKIPGTRLLFLEVLPDGTQFPILNTTRASGRYRFRVETGSGYGTRKLRVILIHGNGPAGSRVLARYRVNAPRKLPAPPAVSAWRDGFIVNVYWAGTKDARGYLVQVSQRQRDGKVVSFVRQVPARTTSVLIPNFPGLPGRTTATVWTLNSDGVIGKGRSSSFRTSPSALTLKAAADATARGAYSDRGAVVARTQCPVARAGYCQVLLTLSLNGRSIVTAGDQVAPGTFHFVRLRPRNPALRRALARALAGRGGHVRVSCIMFRLAQRGYTTARGTVI